MAHEGFNLSTVVKARMITRQEVLRARVLNSGILGEETIRGLIDQYALLNAQLLGILKAAVFALFAAFVAWRGGSISIPGTGSTISEIPAFFELSLVVCAFSLMMVPFLFINTQLYEAVISVLIDSQSHDRMIDGDLIRASKMPVWFFIKYMNSNPIIGRQNIYEINRLGRITNSITLFLISIILICIYFLMNGSVVYLATIGLGDSLSHWFIYLVCITCAFVAFAGCCCFAISFKHSIRPDLLLEDAEDPVFASDVRPERNE
ncbi:MAG: hypothetical protein AAF590_03240 [Pseudomonadota bacterium]